MSILVTKGNQSLIRPAEYMSLFKRAGYTIVAAGPVQMCEIILEELQ